MLSLCCSNEVKNGMRAIFVLTASRYSAMNPLFPSPLRMQGGHTMWSTAVLPASSTSSPACSPPLSAQPTVCRSAHLKPAPPPCLPGSRGPVHRAGPRLSGTFHPRRSAHRPSLSLARRDGRRPRPAPFPPRRLLVHDPTRTRSRPARPPWPHCHRCPTPARNTCASYDTLPGLSIPPVIPEAETFGRGHPGSATGTAPRSRSRLIAALCAAWPG
jgi:hypothetical protein